MFTTYAVFIALAVTVPQGVGAITTSAPLKSGDRIALVGGGVLEQERTHGYLETVLVSRHPDADLVIRNLAWGGDTVRGAARTSGYQQPDGIARLLKELQEFKPTVIFLGYGMNESFAGTAGLPGFIDDYDKLLARLAPLKARQVILSPTYHEDLGRPLPDPAKHNEDLVAYTATLKKLAAQRGAEFVDLHAALSCYKQRQPKAVLTTNGLLLTNTGSAIVAQAVRAALDFPAFEWEVCMDATRKLQRADGATVDRVQSGDGVIQFRVVDARLPSPSYAGTRAELQRLKVAGLAPGDYALKIDGDPVAMATAAAWQAGVELFTGPAFRDAEKLRAAIVRKNELFYRRWRPFNDHSRHWGFMQGDFALYDKEIAEQERVIAAARRPRPHTYVLSRKEAK